MLRVKYHTPEGIFSFFAEDYFEDMDLMFFRVNPIEFQQPTTKVVGLYIKAQRL